VVLQIFFISGFALCILLNMLTEREVLVSALKMTEEGDTQIEAISREAHVPIQIARKVLAKYSEMGILRINGTTVAIRGKHRLETALKAMELGADVERVCGFLTWEEFEDISILAFEVNDFSVKKHFRFSGSGRRWEIDILGLREPIVVSVDCKHWHHGWRGVPSTKAVEQQIERTKALVQALPTLQERIDIGKWRYAYFVPLVLSLVPSAQKFHKGAPIVPVLQMRDFLQEMPAYINEMTHFHKRHLSEP